MAFEEENQMSKLANHRKPKIWTDALNRAIKRREEEDPRALEKLADKLLRKVDDGDVAAIRELGDRLQGKSLQEIEHKGDVTVFNGAVNK